MSSENNRMEVAARYKARRIELGYTQQQLAERLGVNRHTIAKREAGVPGYPIGEEAWLAICSLGKKLDAKAE